MKENEVYIVEASGDIGTHFHKFKNKSDLDRYIENNREAEEEYGYTDTILHIYIAREVKFKIKTKEVPTTKKVSYIEVEE